MGREYEEAGNAMRFYFVIETPVPYMGVFGGSNVRQRRFQLLYIPTRRSDLENSYYWYMRKAAVKRDYFLWDLLGDRKWVWKLWFKLTGKCGVWGEGHWPLWNNPYEWMWTKPIRERVSINVERITQGCEVCGYVHSYDITLNLVTDDRTDEMKEDGKKYAKDLIQPFRQGELSKEYVEHYPEQVQKMVKSGTITREQVKKSKPVWKGDIKGI